MKKQTENTIQNSLPFDGPVPGTTVTGAFPATAAEPPVAIAHGTDIEELRHENEQLKTTIRMTAAHRQITGELAKAGARSPELLFESIKADLQFSDDGTAQNAAALVERLKRNFPEQFGYERPTSSIDAGAGRTAVPQLTKETLAKMKPAEIAELDWADVKRVLAEA